MREKYFNIRKRIGIKTILIMILMIFAITIMGAELANVLTNFNANGTNNPTVTDANPSGEVIPLKAFANKPEFIKLTFYKKLPEINSTELKRRNEMLNKSHVSYPPIKQEEIPVGPPSNSETKILSQQMSNINTRIVPQQTLPPINIYTNAPTDIQGGNINEPSEGADNTGQNIFYTANVYAAKSSDNGATFSYIDPYADFPKSGDFGFCCDQDVVYDSNRNMFVWYRQGYFDTVNKTQYVRLGVSNDDGNSWFFYNIHPTDVNNTWIGWFDYPQLALDGKYLYLSTDLLGPNAGQYRGVVLQLPLDALQLGQSFEYFYSIFPNIGLGFAQKRISYIDTPTQMFWGAHNTNTNFRLFRWNEITNLITYYDRKIAPWTIGKGFFCVGPDGLNWCINNNPLVRGGWHAKGQIGFFWNVQQGNGFNYPYIDSATFDDTTFSYINRPLIYNQTFAVQWSYAAPDIFDNIGIDFFYGGGPYYPSYAVGLSDEKTGLPPPWQVIGVNFGTNGSNFGNNGTLDWGDYIRVRSTESDHLWTATGYTIQNGSIDSRYIVFGRHLAGPSIVETNLSKSRVRLGENVTDNATVIGFYSIPTGNVDFQYSTDSKTWATYDTESLVNGKATSIPVSPPIGLNHICGNCALFRAVYSGDSTNEVNTSNNTAEQLTIYPPITDLGTLPGFTYSYSSSINNLGQIVGASGNGNPGIFHAVLWNKTRSNYLPTDIGILLKNNNSAATSINNFGDIVGWDATNVSYGHAILWDKVGTNYTITDLGTLPGGNISFAAKINDIDQIVGTSNDASGIYHAVLWDKFGAKYKIKDLGSLLGLSSYAFDINNNGLIVGTNSNNTYAVLWNKSGPNYVISIIGQNAIATGINDINQIVGTMNNRGVLWNQAGTNFIPTILPILSGDTNSNAAKINNFSKIVGYGCPSTPIQGCHAILWTKNGANYISINLGGLGGDTSTAQGIDNRDNYVSIVGSSTNTDGFYRAVLWNMSVP